MRGEGIDALIDAIAAHQEWLRASDGLAARRRSREAFLLHNVVRDHLARRVDEILEQSGFGDELIERLVARELDPYAAAAIVLERMGLSD